MTPRIPKPLTAEHEELHAELVKLTRVRGKVGEAARAVAAVLHPHFVKEEAYALPPLGLLAALAAGPPTPEMRAVLPMTDRLRAELPQMLDEHKAVVGALRRLAAAGRREKKPAAVRLAEEMTIHALREEQVLYPAAILVGEYVKARTGGSAP